MSSGTDLSSEELESVVYRDVVDACQVTSEMRLLLCVSGGVDSMALLHLMGAVKGKYLPELSIEVLNFNHNLRPEESRAEKDTVETWAKHYDFPFHHVERGAKEAFGETGVQEAAREWRQETVRTLLEQYRKRDTKASMIAAIVGDQGEQGKKDGTGKVAVAATGHHMDDQLETMMLKITRGVHISRMYPMLPRSTCGNFIKPLLSVSKEQLQQYMHDHDYPWHEDESNTDKKYKRNAIRMDLVPVMAEVAGGKEALHRRLAAISEQSLQLREWLEREARAFILSQAGSTFGRGEDVCFPVDAFSALPAPVQLEVVHSIVQQSTGSTLDYSHTKKVVALALEETRDGQASRAINLSDSWMATRLGAMVRFHDKQLWTELGASTMTTKCLSGELSVSHPASVRVQVVNGDSDNGSDSGDGGKLCLSLTLQTDTGRSRGIDQLVVRYPRAGDRLGPRRLSESLRGWRVPVHERDRVFVLARHSDDNDGGDSGSDENGDLLGVFLPSLYGGSVPAPPFSGKGGGADDASRIIVEIIG